MRSLVTARIPRKTASSSVKSLPAAKKRVRRMLAILVQTIPDAHVALDSSNPLELLIATILSAQCTDDRVNQVTPKLFLRYPTAVDLANADPGELESIIRPTGFFKSKARHLMGCGRALVEHFNGIVPSSMEELTILPGVGRKTANVILGNYFGKPAVVVDTHVKRVANRLGLTTSQDPNKIEVDIQSLLPKALWTLSAQRMLLHGRHVCQARTPNCEQCALYAECGWEGKRRLP